MIQSYLFLSYPIGILSALQSDQLIQMLAKFWNFKRFSYWTSYLESSPDRDEVHFLFPHSRSFSNPLPEGVEACIPPPQLRPDSGLKRIKYASIWSYLQTYIITNRIIILHNISMYYCTKRSSINSEVKRNIFYSHLLFSFFKWGARKERERESDWEIKRR